MCQIKLYIAIHSETNETKAFTSFDDMQLFSRDHGYSYNYYEIESGVIPITDDELDHFQ